MAGDGWLEVLPENLLPVGDSPLDFIGSRRLPMDDGARVRPPLRVRVDPDVFSAHPRVWSVLARGLKLRVPSSVLAVWRPTRVSPLMTQAVTDFVPAGVLAPGGGSVVSFATSTA